MSYCLNPNCQKPQNPEVNKLCHQCGSKLLLKERYQVLKPISKGGFGQTFLAVDTDKPSQPKCVVKQFLPFLQGNNALQKAKELFEQEALQLEILGKHNQIPELLGNCEQDGYLYLVQEFIEGQTLAEELEANDVFNEQQIRQLLSSLLPVLKFVHEHQVIHRDIKPTNIIRRAKDRQLILIDFGAAKSATATALLRTGTVIGEKWGFIDTIGKIVIHPQFDDADSFSEGRARVKIGGKYGFINKTGQIVISLQFNNAYSFSEGLAAVKIGEKWGYIDTTGQIVSQLFDGIDFFSEGLAAVKIGRKWGYINTTGRIVIQPQFGRASQFYRGRATVSAFLLPYKYTINKMGNIFKKTWNIGV